MKAALELVLFLLTGILVSVGGIVVAAVGVCALVVGSCWWWLRRHRPGG